MKGFIIDPTYRIKDNKAYLYFYGRLENGESFLTINETRLYFFIKKADLKKAEELLKKEKLNITLEESDMKDFQKQPVVKILVDVPPTIPKLRKEFEDNGIQCYEADIRFVYRTIIDKEILGSIEIEGEFETAKLVNRIYTEQAITRATIHTPKLTVLSFDIETSMNTEEIFSIAIAARNYKEDKTIRKNFIVAKHKVAHPHTETFHTEKDMLEAFQKTVNEIDPDIITGWNVIDFDFRVIKDRCKHYRIPFQIGRSEEETKVRIESQFFKDSSVSIVGRQVLDGIALLKNSFIKLDDYKLDTAAKVIIGKKKALDFSSDSAEHKHKLGKGAQIEELFKHDPLTLVKYNEKDAELVLEILEAKDLINLVIQRSMLTGMQIDRVNASIASLDSLYIREARKRGYVCPGSAYSEGEERIKGGFVRDSIPGIYDYIIVCDFKSLYPSIIRTFNIDPLSFQKDGTIIAPNGARFRNEEGILPLLIERLWQQRDEAKKKKDAVASYAIKIAMNCFSPDTEILTENGLKRIGKAEIGEKVYSINPKNNTIDLLPISKKYHYSYKGKMIRIKSNVVDYLVTPNHKFLVDFGKGYEWKTALELANGWRYFWFPEHVKIAGKKINKWNLEEFCKKHNVSYKKKGDKLQKAAKHSSIVSQFEMKDWLEFLGWYIAEGFVYTSKPKRYPGNVSWRGVSKKVTISQKIKRNRVKIKNLFKRLGFKIFEDINGININNAILAEVLEKECGNGSAIKRIPEWVYNLDHSLLQHLFTTMMAGDGDAKGDRYSTKSKRLAEDFLRLIHHLGLYGFIYLDTPYEKGVRSQIFRVQVNKKRGIRPYISPSRNISIEEYEGDVMCVEVKPHHTVLAGRNSRLNFCGQSFYGVLASPMCRFYSLEMASAITGWGQEIVKESAEEVEKIGYKVIYGDTDSIFIETKKDNYEDAAKIGEKIAHDINVHFQKKVKEQCGRESYLELQFEKVYSRFIMPKIRGTEVGAKKRYAGMRTDGKEEKLDIVGLETVRRDWTECAKQFQITLLKKIFAKHEVIPYIKKFVDEVKAGKHDNLLIYRKSLSKDVKGYIKTTPPHVKAAKLLDKIESNIIEYYITENGPEPLQKLKSKIDYNHYVDKQLKPIADSILLFFNQNFEDVVSGKKQKSLMEF